MNKIILLLLLNFFIIKVIAEENKPIKNWKDIAELSYLNAKGNSNTSNISGKNFLKYDFNKYSFELIVSGLGTKTENKTTSEEYNASEKISFKLSGKNYTFEQVSWDKNRFSGIKDRYNSYLGLGREILNIGKNEMFFEIGSGYTFEDRLNVENQSFANYKFNTKYIRKLSDSASFEQNIEYFGNFKKAKDYRFNLDTNIITSISTKLSLKTSYLLKYSNYPTSGFKKTDNFTSIALIINY